MPHIACNGGALELSFSDSPKLLDDFRTKLYLKSILGLEYNGKSSYLGPNIDNLIQSAILIRDISRYLNDSGQQCTFDQTAQSILNGLMNSDGELKDDMQKGSHIKKDTPNSITPPDFIRPLKPYQMRSVMLTTDLKNSANFSVPGSGKTAIAYAAYSILKQKGVITKLIVIGPRSSFMPWEDEYKECFGKIPNSLRVIGLSREEFKEEANGAELILMTYQMASSINSSLIEFMSKVNCLLVLDESHNIKRFDGGVWAASILKIAPYARRRLILSGTPMPNTLLDLWSQFTFLWPFKNLLGEAQSFKRLAESRGGTENVRQLVDPFFCRITKKELDLPAPEFKPIIVPLRPIQNALYQRLAVQTLAEINDAPADKSKLREWRRAKMIRLLQAASNPALLAEYSEEFRIPPLSTGGLPVVSLIENYTDHEMPSKLVKAVELANEVVAAGEKVIIWTTFVQNVKTLEKMLHDKRPITIYGDIPKDSSEDEFVNRERRIREFKADMNPRVLIATPNSCAESISLHKICKKAIYLDRTFNAGQYIQSLDRIHRLGLDPEDKITYYLLIGKGTIDDVINTRLREKYQRMLNMLNDELPIMDLEVQVSEMSDSDFEKDFASVISYLQSAQNGNSYAQQFE